LLEDEINSFFGPSLVTGGAGFIGSHIVDKLVQSGNQVKVLDNLSSGILSNLTDSDGKFEFIKKDLKNLDGSEEFMGGIKTVFHMAANPEVRMGFQNPEVSFNENILSTFRLLESIRKYDIQSIVFASSSTVYGECEIIPTPEDFAPLLPISPYGASKLACEALISSYCHNYGIDGTMCRFANIVGSRSNHGVIYDFVKKLQKNNSTLEVLGDGKQTKSYVHVNDCINGFFFSALNKKNNVEIFNMGNFDDTNVLKIAEIVLETLGLKNVGIKTTNLDILKLKNLGWSPKMSSDEAVKLSTTEIIHDLNS
jgi:UDP-glucose 4-epimerase